MVIATVHVADERYAAQRPDHIHRHFLSEKEANEWIEQLTQRLGDVKPEVARISYGYRCPHCGWVA